MIILLEYTYNQFYNLLINNIHTLNELIMPASAGCKCAVVLEGK